MAGDGGRRGSLTGGPLVILRGGSGFVGHFVSFCYRMSIPCPARNAIGTSTQSALYGTGNGPGGSEVSNATRSSGGDVGREPRELRNMVIGQAGVWYRPSSVAL